MSELQLTLNVKRKGSDRRYTDWRKIVSDRDKLSRIVYNLINNALKYSQEGTPLKVSARFESNEVTISVTDSGFRYKY